MKHLDGILEMVDKELGSIEKNGQFRSRDEVDSVYKLIDIAKDTMEIWCMEDDMGGESYDDGMSYERGRRSYDGNSYARGRRNARRDERGRYSRDGYMDSYNDGRSMRGYSRADGMEDYKNRLRMMMDEAPDEQTRMKVQRMMDSM